MSNFPPPRRIALRILAAVAAAFASISLCAGSSRADGDGPVIAAAANLQFALEEIAEAFKKSTGHSVRISFGSSGNFVRQIRQGAPFEMFLSADEKFVRDLVDAGLTRDTGTLYAVGRIALFVPHGSQLEPDATLDDLAKAIDDGRITRFAIANPEHAPYGKRAVEALQHRGLWDKIQPKLIYGENVSQAAQFALSGNAQGGIIAYSIALVPRFSAAGRFVLIPEEWHSPLRQSMVLLKSAGPVAERFFAYVQEPEAREVFRKYGFLLPGEAP